MLDLDVFNDSLLESIICPLTYADENPSWRHPFQELSSKFFHHATIWWAREHTCSPEMSLRILFQKLYLSDATSMWDFRNKFHETKIHSANTGSLYLAKLHAIQQAGVSLCTLQDAKRQSCKGNEHAIIQELIKTINESETSNLPEVSVCAPDLDALNKEDTILSILIPYPFAIPRRFKYIFNRLNEADCLSPETKLHILFQKLYHLLFIALPVSAASLKNLGKKFKTLQFNERNTGTNYLPIFTRLKTLGSFFCHPGNFRNARDFFQKLIHQLEESSKAAVAILDDPSLAHYFDETTSLDLAELEPLSFGNLAELDPKLPGVFVEALDAQEPTPYTKFLRHFHDLTISSDSTTRAEILARFEESFQEDKDADPKAKLWYGILYEMIYFKQEARTLFLQAIEDTRLSLMDQLYAAIKYKRLCSVQDLPQEKAALDQIIQTRWQAVKYQVSDISSLSPSDLLVLALLQISSFQPDGPLFHDLSQKLVRHSHETNFLNVEQFADFLTIFSEPGALLHTPTTFYKKHQSILAYLGLSLSLSHFLLLRTETLLSRPPYLPTFFTREGQACWDLSYEQCRRVADLELHASPIKPVLKQAMEELSTGLSPRALQVLKKNTLRVFLPLRFQNPTQQNQFQLPLALFFHNPLGLFPCQSLEVMTRILPVQCKILRGLHHFENQTENQRILCRRILEEIPNLPHHDFSIQESLDKTRRAAFKNLATTEMSPDVFSGLTILPEHKTFFMQIIDRIRLDQWHDYLSDFFNGLLGLLSTASFGGQILRRPMGPKAPNLHTNFTCQLSKKVMPTLKKIIDTVYSFRPLLDENLKNLLANDIGLKGELCVIQQSGEHHPCSWFAQWFEANIASLAMQRPAAEVEVVPPDCRELRLSDLRAWDARHEPQGEQGRELCTMSSQGST